MKNGKIDKATIYSYFAEKKGRHMISFEPITADTMYIVSEIINSNEAYNVLENGKKRAG